MKDSHRARLAKALLANPTGRHFGYPLARQARIRSYAIYPALEQMLKDGWVTEGWAHQWRDGGGQAPPRRYYTLTEVGCLELQAWLR